jgi:hypothetical protein
MRNKLFPEEYEALIQSGCSRAGVAMKSYMTSLENAKINFKTTYSTLEYLSRAAILNEESGIVPCTGPGHENCAVNNARNQNKEVARSLIDGYSNIEPCCMDCMRIHLCGMKHLKCRLDHRLSRLVISMAGPPQAT